MFLQENIFIQTQLERECDTQDFSPLVFEIYISFVKVMYLLYGIILSCIDYLHVRMYGLDGFCHEIDKGEIASATFS